MVQDRQLEIAQTRLVWIGPQEFVGGAERALQHKAVLDQPALQKLILERVVVVSDHGQAGHASQSSFVQIRLSGAGENGNAVLVLGRLERRRVVTKDLVFG